MALCSFSSSLSMDGVTLVENTFLSEFLPNAPEGAVKTYLYGRFLCSNPHEEDNTLESMAAVLDLSEDELLTSFSYWEDMGLVTIVKKQPIEIKFLPIKVYTGSGKLRNKEKYADFNKQAQELLTSRQITPNEFNEYYTLIETYHFEPEAVIMIIRYCTELKGNGVNYPYILAVAKSFARDNIKTEQAVSEKLEEQERASAEIKAVLTALGVRREADAEERNLYLKWTNGLGFTQGVILDVAKSQGKTGGMHKLDSTLTKYYELHLMSVKEINEYASTRENLFNIAREVTRTIGQYYQVLDGVVETYVTSWVQKGFSRETLNLIATYCLSNNLRTLDTVNETINRFFKLGLISTEAINQYIDDILNENNKIKSVLELAGLLRNVNSSDRELYKVWHNDWQLPDDVIRFVAQNSKSREYPISYINKILSEFHAKNIVTLDAAKANLSQSAATSAKAKTENNKEFSQRSYSKGELSALFDSLDDVEI